MDKVWFRECEGNVEPEQKKLCKQRHPYTICLMKRSGAWFDLSMLPNSFFIRLPLLYVEGWSLYTIFIRMNPVRLDQTSRSIHLMFRYVKISPMNCNGRCVKYCVTEYDRSVVSAQRFIFVVYVTYVCDIESTKRSSGYKIKLGSGQK